MNPNPARKRTKHTDPVQWDEGGKFAAERRRAKQWADDVEEAAKAELRRWNIEE